MNLEELTTDWSALWLPPAKLPLADWAEQNFYLSKYSAQQGLIRLFPFQRDPFNAFTDPAVSTIVLKVGTQLIKTVLIQAAIAYAMCEAAGPILVTQPDDTAAMSFSKERIAPMISDCPKLAAIISPSHSRNGSNTNSFKEFPGGTLSILGAVSPSNAARRSIQYYFGDEIDKYPPSSGKEGTFVELAAERLATFGSRSKQILACSATIPGSPISRKYESSDQRKPWVPCPSCGTPQILKWIQVRWDQTLPDHQKAESAHYECEHCSAHWNDYLRWSACEKIEWRASKPFRGIAGFWISHLYSPHKRLSQIVQKWLDAEASGNANDLKVFINTNLAEDWVEKGDAPPFEQLLDRREDYLGSVPKGVLLVAAGADVHPDRIEVEVVGWGRRRESWSLDYQVLWGPTSESEVWEKLALLMGEVYVTEDGAEMPISRLFVDSGHSTNDVYAWVRQQASGRIVAIKGEHRGLLPVGPPSPVDVTIAGRKIKSGLKIRTVLVSYFKSELYADLAKRKPTDEELKAGANYPPGYCHFPKDGNYGDEHFKQICSEQLVTTRDRRGRERREWQQTRPRNEALDCRVYARAAAWSLGMDRFKEHHWKELEGRAVVVIPETDQEAHPTDSAPAPEEKPGDLFLQTSANPAKPRFSPQVPGAALPRPRPAIRLVF